jgi:hypothetical protein
MAFNYDKMRNLADSLLTKFGNNFVLKKPEGKPAYNPVTKKNVQKYKDFTGKCVMKPYTTEMIGMLSNIVNAGDVQFKCVFDDETVIPEEGVDKIVFGDILYNIIGIELINPAGNKIIIYTFHCRRAV